MTNLEATQSEYLSSYLGRFKLDQISFEYEQSIVFPYVSPNLAKLHQTAFFPTERFGSTQYWASVDLFVGKFTRQRFNVIIEYVLFGNLDFVRIFTSIKKIIINVPGGNVYSSGETGRIQEDK